MADHYAYLSGGPCDGKRVKLTVADMDSLSLICKGSLYTDPNATKRPNGDFLYTYAGVDPRTGTDVKAAHAHGGWKDLRTSLNVRMPAAHQQSQRTLSAALRTVARARKVRL